MAKETKAVREARQLKESEEATAVYIAEYPDKLLHVLEAVCEVGFILTVKHGEFVITGTDDLGYSTQWHLKHTITSNYEPEFEDLFSTVYEVQLELERNEGNLLFDKKPWIN
jgi:hypothetical protein